MELDRFDIARRFAALAPEKQKAFLTFAFGGPVGTAGGFDLRRSHASMKLTEARYARTSGRHSPASWSVFKRGSGNCQCR